jgi:hypothetical protein
LINWFSHRGRYRADEWQYKLGNAPFCSHCLLKRSRMLLNSSQLSSHSIANSWNVVNTFSVFWLVWCQSLGPCFHLLSVMIRMISWNGPVAWRSEAFSVILDKNEWVSSARWVFWDSDDWKITSIISGHIWLRRMIHIALLAPNERTWNSDALQRIRIVVRLPEDLINCHEFRLVWWPCENIKIS